MIRILLADDHTLVREGLRALLARETDLKIVAEAGDGREALQRAREARPDVAALDLSMPLLNGLEAARQMAGWERGPRPILLTVHAEDEYILEALRAGIRGYVLKKQAGADLVRAIREVAAGGVYLSPSISATLVEAVRDVGSKAGEPALSPREREVLQLVAEGKTTKEIGTILGVSAKTADAHRTRLMQKLKIHDTASLTRYAIRQGVIQP
jgi:two-component system response regulator NreC